MALFASLIIATPTNFHILSPKKKSLTHLEQLTERYPYGLLSDDYGILNFADLKQNTAIGFPQKFSADSITYPYWQCYPLKNSHFLCDPTTSEHPEYGKDPAFVVIQLSVPHFSAKYSARRPTSLADCKLQKKKWIQLTAHQQMVCMSGSYNGGNESNADQRWTWEAYKTKKGCASYFEGGCAN